MAQKSNSFAEPQIPADLLAEKREGWKSFTQATALACVLTALAVMATIVFAKVL